MRIMSRKLRVAPFPIGQIKNDIIRRVFLIVMFIPIIAISLPIGLFLELFRFLGRVIYQVFVSIRSLSCEYKTTWHKPLDRKWKMFTIIEESSDE